MIAQKRCGQLMAARMVEDAKLCLEDLKAEGQTDWLQTLSPDWTDSVALLRSVYAARCNVASMIRISQLTGSSTHSFCILLTIMRAIEFNDWTQACKMWAFENAPDGGHPIVGGTPEMMLECDTAHDSSNQCSMGVYTRPKTYLGGYAMGTSRCLVIAAAVYYYLHLYVIIICVE